MVPIGLLVADKKFKQSPITNLSSLYRCLILKKSGWGFRYMLAYDSFSVQIVYRAS